MAAMVFAANIAETPGQKSGLCVFLPATQPALNQRRNGLGIVSEQVDCAGFDIAEHGFVAKQVGDMKLKLSGLTGAKYLSGAAQTQVFFGDDKTVVGFPHNANALFGL